MGTAALVKQYIGRFHIAVDNAPFVHIFQRLGDAVKGGRGRFQPHRPLFGQFIRQRAARHVAHHQKKLVAILSKIMHGHNAGVLQGGNDLRFLLEPLVQNSLGRQRGRHHLYRYLALFLRVIGAVHLAHPPSAEFFLYLVLPDGLHEDNE